MPAASTNTPSTMNRMPPTLTRASSSVCASPGSPEDVVGAEQADPNHVDEVPVERRGLDPRVVVDRELAPVRLQHHQIEEQRSTEHVGEVEAGHRVEQGREDVVTKAELQLRVVVELEDEEGRPQGQRDLEPADQPAGVAALDRREARL